MNFLRPENNLSSFAQVVCADGIDKYVVKRIRTNKGKNGIDDISEYADQSVTEADLILYFF